MGSTDDLGAQVIEERIEAAGGGTVELIDPPGRIVAAIGHVGHSATSWVMVTPGRIPPWALAAMTRSDVASLASATALLTQTSRTGSTLELGLSGLSHYMADSSGQTEAGIIPGLFVGSNLTLADCAALYIGTTSFSNVRRGTISAGIGAPANVTLDGEHHDSLSFTKWLAYQFRASWRVILKSTADGMWPHVDIGTLGDLWGNELLTRHLVTPDMASAPPMDGTWLVGSAVGPCRIIRGKVKQDGNGEGLISDSWVHADPKDNDIPAIVGRATAALDVQHVNGLGYLRRHKRFQSTNKWPNATRMNAVAEQVLSIEGQPIESWSLDIDDPTDIGRLPLGAPVGLMDAKAGIFDTDTEAQVGAHGAAPKLGARVIARKLPWREGMGCYLAHAGTDEGWRVIDLSPYIDEEEGAVEIAQTVGRSTLADAISGTARI